MTNEAPENGAPVAVKVHELPGRARFRVPERRGDVAYFRDVEEAFDLCPGVLVVEARAKTGSLLIRHEGDLDPVWRFARERRLFVPETPERTAPDALDRVLADAHQLDAWFRRSSGGEISVGTIVTFALLAMSVVQLARGQVLAPAVTLAWYAATVLRERSVRHI
jgi:hypothetical protein